MEIINSCEKITQKRKVRTGCCVLKKAAQKWMLLVGMMAQETCGSWGWEEDAYPEPFALPSVSVRGEGCITSSVERQLPQDTPQSSEAN